MIPFLASGIVAARDSYISYYILILVPVKGQPGHCPSVGIYEKPGRGIIYANWVLRCSILGAAGIYGNSSPLCSRVRD